VPELDTQEASLAQMIPKHIWDLEEFRTKADDEAVKTIVAQAEAQGYLRAGEQVNIETTFQRYGNEMLVGSAAMPELVDCNEEDAEYVKVKWTIHIAKVTLSAQDILDGLLSARGLPYREKDTEPGEG
jgi:hypothetical protein